MKVPLRTPPRGRPGQSPALQSAQDTACSRDWRDDPRLWRAKLRARRAPGAVVCRGLQRNQMKVILDWRRAHGVQCLHAILLMALLLPVSAVSAPRVMWRLAEHPRRVMFKAPAEAGPCVLVSLELDDDTLEPGGVSAFDPAGGPLPCRLVHTETRKADVLVGLGKPQDTKGDYAVYYGGPPGADATPDLHDSLPIAVDVYKRSGRSVPTSWRKMFYLAGTAGRAVDMFLLPGLGDLALFEEHERASRQKESDRWIAVLSTFVQLPDDGVYRFALDCHDAGFLLIDGETMVGWPGRHPGGEWRVGPPVFMKAGPHAVQIYSCSKIEATLRLGWIRPGAEEVTPIESSAFLAAFRTEETRTERIDKLLHPGFAHTVRPSYSFWGTDTIFTPVNFENRTEAWIQSQLQCRWVFGEGDEAPVEGPRAYRVLVGARRHEVGLTVRDALGFVAGCRRTVDTRLVQPRLYPFAAELLFLPAVAYASDIVEPQLQVTGELPGGQTGVDVVWEVATRAGVERVESERLVPSMQQTQRMRLMKAVAGELDRINWRVLHHGVVLAGGMVRFVEPPFTALPDQVRGDRIYDADGVQLVLVPPRRAGVYAQPPITTEQAFGALLCIDDMLAAPELPASTPGPSFDRVLARIVNGPDRPRVRYLSLPAWNQAPEAFGPLLKLCQIPAAVDPATDVVILSIGLKDLLDANDPDVFERQVAALSDIVSWSMGCAVVWVTPPPYSRDPTSVRAFAAAIRRVSAARRIPVADLYSAFLGTRRQEHGFMRGQELVLSREGRDLTAEIIARALLMQ